ncbi:hypothetical protein Tco_0386282 [Tanacetum coccineum]
MEQIPLGFICVANNVLANLGTQPLERGSPIGNIHVARLTPDDIEARSDWWISSKAYFDGFIDQVERVTFDLSRHNMYEIPSGVYRQFVEQKIELERNKKDVHDIKEEMQKFREEMNARSVRQENIVPMVVGQHYGLSDFSEFRSMQNIPNRGKMQQLPSKYLVTSFTGFEGYMKEEITIRFLGSQFTGNILFYENVDPTKVWRGNYENPVVLGPSTPPSYSSGPLTPPNYSLGSSRNAECSNCKHLRGKISVLKATMEMHMHPEQHTVNSAALFHEVLNEMEKLDLE